MTTNEHISHVWDRNRSGETYYAGSTWEGLLLQVVQVFMLEAIASHIYEWRIVIEVLLPIPYRPEAGWNNQIPMPSKY